MRSSPDLICAVYAPGLSVSSTAASLLPLGSANAPVWIATVAIAELFAQSSLVATTLLSW
jgi:hypothetical protein